MTYFMQGGGKDEFPFFDEQPGNGNGNPPPFAAPIDSFGYSMLIVFLITVVVWTKFFDKSK